MQGRDPRPRTVPDAGTGNPAAGRGAGHWAPPRPVRPRAPFPRPQHGRAVPAPDQAVQGTGPVPRARSGAEAVHDSLEDSLRSLAFFSRHHRGRWLDPGTADEHGGSDAGGFTPSENVHFVNIGRRSRRRRMPAWLEDAQLRTPSSHGADVRAGQDAPDAPAAQSRGPAAERAAPAPSSRPVSLAGAGRALEIPELPRGQLLRLDILSTWGDPFYVGLMGLEAFDSSGHLLPILPSHIAADPADINVLSEYHRDPRSVDKLVDGDNLTCSDMHAWLAPFTQGARPCVPLAAAPAPAPAPASAPVCGQREGQWGGTQPADPVPAAAGDHHYVYVHFDEPVTLAMLRIWNYNKSRIHSHRGARYVEISLDQHYIFKGEIRKAPGAVASPVRAPTVPVLLLLLLLA